MAEDKKPKVHVHEGTGLRYLLGASRVLFETGVALSREEFERYKDDKDEILSNAIIDPAQPVYDWQYACTMGQLRRKRGTADSPRRRKKQPGIIQETPTDEAIVAGVVESLRRTGAQAEEEQKEAVLIPTVQEEGIEDPGMESMTYTTDHEVVKVQYPGKSRAFSSALLILPVMATVGIGSAVMSAYHTSAFLMYGGKPAWTAVTTGVMLILFSATAFTAARYFFREGGALNVFGFLFILAGIAVIAYSMFATLTVNYEQFKWRDDEKAVVAVSESGFLAAHRDLIRQNGEALDDVNREIAMLEGEAEYWRGNSWRRYDEIQISLADARARREALRENRTELVRVLPMLTEVEAVSRDSVYSFLAGLFGAEEDAMRFFVYVIPACLYDILAPFALSIVLLLADRWRKAA